VVQGPWTIESCLPRHNTFLLLQISSPHIQVCLVSQQRPVDPRLKMQLVMAENKESQIGTPDPLTMT